MTSQTVDETIATQPSEGNLDRSISNDPVVETVASDNDGDRFSILEFVVVSFGVWTVGFWFSLLFSWGYVAATGFSILIGAGVWFWLGRPVPWQRLAVANRPSATWRDLIGSPLGVGTSVTLAVVMVAGSATVPIALVVMGIGLALSVWITRPTTLVGEQVVALGVGVVGAAVVVTLYVSSTWGWFIAAISVAAIGAIALALRPHSYDQASSHRPLTELSVLFVGALMALWTAVAPQPNFDDTYYLNKAAHYAQSPWRFAFVDQLFGVEGAHHISTSDFVSSYEPLLGLVSALTGATASMLRAVVFTPLVAVAVPVAIRYVARACRVPRPDVVAVLCAALLCLYPSTMDGALFLSKIIQGKGIAALIYLPFLMGAALLVSERSSRHRILVVIAAAIGLFSLTGSAVPAALGVLGACLVAVALTTKPVRPAVTWIAVTIGVLMLLGVFGYLIEPNTGSAILSERVTSKYNTPESSWVRRASIGGRSGVIEPAAIHTLVMGGLVMAMFVATTRRTRLLVSSLALINFGVIYNPWFFGPVITDALELNWLSWRFGWMLPLGLGFGLAVDAVMRRFGWLGAAIGVLAVVVMWTNATPLKIVWQRPTHDLAPEWREVADEIIRVTPDGGRFLGPGEAEHAVVTISADVYPTFARRIYLDEIPKFGEPEGFHFEERERLLLWMYRQEGRAQGSPDEALEVVDVDTVCLPADLYETPLGDAVVDNYTLDKKFPACDVWTKS